MNKDQDKIKSTADPHHHHHHHHHRRRRRIWRAIAIVLILIVIGVAVVLGLAYKNAKQASDKVYAPATTASEKGRGTLSSLLKAKKPISLMLLGTDTGDLGRTYKGRTDTIMVMTVDPKKKRTLIVSLPRDMKVNLPGYAQDSPAKINAAYTFGGVSETIKTVHDYYEVPIDGYLLVNMGGLKTAIDKVGGVTVTSPLTFDYEGYHFTKGDTIHMGGAKALAFSRMRYDDPRGDYGRQDRQRLIIMALINKSISYQTLLNGDFLNEMASQMQTDLTMGNMSQFALGYHQAKADLVTDFAQGHGQQLDGVDYEVVSQSERQRVSDELRKSLDLKTVTLKERE